MTGRVKCEMSFFWIEPCSNTTWNVEFWLAQCQKKNSLSVVIFGYFWLFLEVLPPFKSLISVFHRVIVLDSNMKYPMTRSEQEYLELHHEAQFMHQEFWKQQNENYKKLASDDKLNPARLAKLKTYHATWREYSAFKNFGPAPKMAELRWSDQHFWTHCTTAI